MYSDSGGLPYDLDDQQPSTSSSSKPYNPLLDQPLDDLINPPRPSGRYNSSSRVSYSTDDSHDGSGHGNRGESRNEPRSKIYLLSELKPMLNGRMASDLLEERGIDGILDDAPSSSLVIPTDDAFRTSAIHFEGTPFSELPTGKVFTYISSYTTALPIGIEWLSDTRLLAIFPSSAAAVVALEHLLLAPSQFASDFAEASSMSNVEGESQKVPVSLWPDEYKTSVKGKGKGRMLAAGEEGGKMRIDGGGEDEEPAKEVDEAVMKGEIKIRWARTDDRKQRRGANTSSFYAKYSHNAGKPKLPSALAPPPPAQYLPENGLPPKPSTSDLLSSDYALPPAPEVDLLDGGFSLDRPAPRRRAQDDAEFEDLLGEGRGGLAERLGAERPRRSRSQSPVFGRRIGERMRSEREEDDGLGYRSRGGRDVPYSQQGRRDRGGGGGSRGRDERRGRARVEDLDSELEGFLAGKTEGRVGQTVQGERGGRGERTAPRPRRTAEEMDKEMEDFLAGSR